MVVGLFTILISGRHDFPAEAHFLSDQERARVLKRLRADGQASADHEELNTKYLKQAFVDWKTYAYSIVYMGAGKLIDINLRTERAILTVCRYAAIRLLPLPPNYHQRTWHLLSDKS